MLKCHFTRQVYDFFFSKYLKGSTDRFECWDFDEKVQSWISESSASPKVSLVNELGDLKKKDHLTALLFSDMFRQLGVNRFNRLENSSSIKISKLARCNWFVKLCNWDAINNLRFQRES